MDWNDKLFAGPLFIYNRFYDLIESSSRVVKLDKDETINYILMNFIGYLKKSGMSFDGFIKKCSLQWTIIDESTSL